MCPSIDLKALLVWCILYLNSTEPVYARMLSTGQSNRATYNVIMFIQCI